MRSGLEQARQGDEVSGHGALAEKANFRHALWQVGEAIADIFSEAVHLVPELKNVYQLDKPNWKILTARWKRN